MRLRLTFRLFFCLPLLAGRMLAFAVPLLLAACASSTDIYRVPTGQDIRIVPITPAVLESQAISRDIARDAPGKIPVQQQGGHVYHIGKGDVLLIKTGESSLRPEGFIALTNEQAGVTVDDAGEIIYPFIGKVHLAGLTLSEAREELNLRLADYFQQPQMDIAVLQFNSQQAFVTGSVGRPGSQPITLQPLTVIRAIDSAGGLAETADYGHAVIESADGSTKPVDLYALLQRGDNRYNYVLQPGDTLHIPETDRNRVMVLGEVLQPGLQQMRFGRKSLAEALAEARGVNEITADERHIYIVRGAIDAYAEKDRYAPGDAPASREEAWLSQTQVYELDLTSPAALALAENFALQPRDVVYVSERPITEWSRFINQLLPGVFTGAVSYRVNQL